jgi:hypothetical protein
MVDNGLLERVPYQEPGQRTRYAYAITPLGLEVFPIIAALAHLGDRLPGDPGKTILLSHAGCGQPVTAEVRCALGHAVQPSDVVVSVMDSPHPGDEPPGRPAEPQPS